MKIKCPKCNSTKIAQYRSITGPIWCIDCQFRVNQKELNNPFIVKEITCESSDSCDECADIKECLKGDHQ